MRWSFTFFSLLTFLRQAVMLQYSTIKWVCSFQSISQWSCVSSSCEQRTWTARIPDWMAEGQSWSHAAASCRNTCQIVHWFQESQHENCWEHSRSLCSASTWRDTTWWNIVWRMSGQNETWRSSIAKFTITVQDIFILYEAMSIWGWN